MRRILGVIPARYQSSRIPGKPLADICGMPMLWWVYKAALEVCGLDGVVCAIDDERVMAVCEKHEMNAIMTSGRHPKHVDRIYEVSEKIKADYYVVMCGDEPLMEPEAVELVLPEADDDRREYVVRSLMRDFDDPVEAYDTASMKAALNAENFCIFLSRSIIPFPYKTVNYKLKRLVGIECYNKKALDFFVSTPTGFLEKIEDITLMRYLENFIPIRLVNTAARQIGVDTPKNLEMVRSIITKRLEEK